VSVFNIKDQRTSENETFCDVVLEVDNSDLQSMGINYHIDNITEWLDKTSIYSAIMAACGFKGRVTMYLYSPGTVEKDHNKLVVVHPGLKENSFSGAKIPSGAYSEF